MIRRTKKTMAVFCILLSLSMLLSGCLPVLLFNVASSTSRSSNSTTSAPTRTLAPKEQVESYRPTPVVRANLAFDDMVYQRPSLDAYSDVVDAFVYDFDAATSAQEQIDLYLQFEQDTNRLKEPVTLASILFYTDVSDETQVEYDYANDFAADTFAYDIKAMQAFAASPYMDSLEVYFGNDMIKSMQTSIDEYDPAMIALQKEIDKLDGEYTRITTQMQEDGITFQNDQYDESELVSYLLYYEFSDQELPLRDEMEAALLAYYEDLNLSCNAIYQELITARTQLANLAGYDSYPAYHFSDAGYTYDEIKTFIAQIKSTMIPIAATLHAQAEESLAAQGLEMTPSNFFTAICPSYYEVIPVYYDEATNDDDLEQMEYDAATSVLRAMMPQTKELIDYLEDYQMIDVFSSASKNSGAFTTFFDHAKQPFVYADSVNATTILHESGHALDFYNLPEIDTKYRFYTGTEISEVHSMGLETLAYEYYDMLYGDTAEYAIAAQIYEGLESILSQTMFHEYELALYENPTWTREQRNQYYQELSDEYYYSVPNFPLYSESGLTWVGIHHFFGSPLYTIDYAIAQVVSFEIWDIQEDDPDAAKDKYMTFLLDNLQTDLQIRLENAELSDPFDAKNLTDLAEKLHSFFTDPAYTQPSQTIPAKKAA